MIIKKKYTTIKKISEKQNTENSPKTDETKVISEIENNKKVQAEEKKVNEKVVQKTEPEKSEKQVKNFDDLNLSIDNIQFEQREERREGSRRRGYRRSQDRNIISRAQKEAELIKENAKKEGYEAGVEALKEDIKELRENFAEFFEYKDKVFDKVSECITDIAVEIASKIINKHIEADREYLIPMIKGVVEEINKTENKIILKVMPKDVEIVKDKISEIFSENNTEASISVVADKEIKDGGVIVETSNGIVDASVTTQLAIMEKALKKQEEG